MTMLETPILFIIFNRPGTTRRSFEAIRQQKPKYLFVAADGPRPHIPEDIQKCQTAREEIQVDWDCELKTLFRAENRGCGHMPAEAISWFFENVEMGIILEDDCLLTSYGFQFYENLLKYFANNKNIGVITATNCILRWKRKRTSYVVSGPGTPTMGCWASWRRAWSYFNYNINALDDPEILERIRKNFKFQAEYNFWLDNFHKRQHSDEDDIWDYQWQFSRAAHVPITIVSSVNMVSNIGFHDEATHTRTITKYAGLPTFNSIPSIIHPGLKRDYLYEWVVFQRYFNTNPHSLLKKMFLKMITILNGN